MLNIYRDNSQRPDDLLLLSLDGLDELNSTESRSLLDFIPKPSQLTEGCYVLLTSRLKDGCPEPIWRQLNNNPPLTGGGRSGY